MINQFFLKETANKLRKLADRIEQINFDEIEKYNTISISFAEIDTPKAEEVCNVLSSWGKKNKGSRYLYIIQATSETDINKCHQTYENAKKENKNKKGGRAYARLNKNKDSNVFYVGSSSSLSSRIEQHLGLSKSKGTYALQAQHWLKGISGELIITIWRFPASIGQDVIQAVEDGLWEKCKPMFGRRGAK